MLTNQKEKKFIRLRDYVNEMFLLEVISPYNCPDKPGKVFGYNPILKKCIDITDYDGPDRPRGTIKSPNYRAAEDDFKKPGVDDFFKGLADPDKPLIKKAEEIARALAKPWLSAMDPQEVKQCYDENKVFSIAGIIYGRPFITLTYKIPATLFRAGANAAFNMADPVRGDVQRTLQRIEDAKKSKFWSKFKAAVKKSAKGKLALVAGTVLGIGAAGTTAVWAVGKYSGLEGDIMGLNPQKMSKGIEDAVIGENSIQNWNCFAMAAVLSFSLPRLGKLGLVGAKTFIKGVTGSVKSTSVSLFKNLINLPSFRRTFEQNVQKALDRVDISEVEKFFAIRNLEALENAKIILDKTSGTGLLKVENFNSVIKIPADKVPKDLSNLVKDGFLTVDPKIINKQLADASKEISETVISDVGQNLNKFKASRLAGDMKLLARLQEVGGNLTKLKSKSLEKLTIDLESLYDVTKNQIAEINDLSKKISKSEPRVKNVVKQFNRDIDEVQQLALRTPADQISSEIGKLAPDLGSNAKNLIIDYMKNFKNSDLLERQLLSELKMAEAVIRSEASVMSRIASKEEAGVFTDWLSQATGSERSFWDKIIRGFSADLYRGFKASTELSNVVNRIFSVTGLVAPAVPAIGLLYNAYNLEPIGPNEIGNLKVYTAEFFKNQNVSAYIKGDEVSIDDLMKLYLRAMRKFEFEEKIDYRSLEIIKMLVEETKTNEKKTNIRNELEELFNGDNEVPTPEEVKIKFNSILDSFQFNTPEQTDDKDEPESKTDNTNASIVQQFKENEELVGKGPKNITLLGQEVTVQFGKKTFKFGDKKFQFKKGPLSADINSAKRIGNELVIQLQMIISQTYRLDDSEILELFRKTKDIPRGGDKYIKLDGKSGTIKNVTENKSKEVKIMNKENLSDMVKKILTENSGKGYSKYPYGSSVRDEEEPQQDYVEDWKALSLNLIRDESRNTAISIAKILVKDLELFEDVLDLAGQNQSVGQEILRKLQESEEEK